MLLAMSSGATGGGFISTAAGPLLLVGLVLSVVAVPAIRETLGVWLRSGREHLVGPADADAAEPNQIGTGETDTGPMSGRASDRDSYDFDLDVLTEGDTC